MKTFRSYFIKNGKEYEPVHGDAAVADSDTTCIRCGQAAGFTTHNPKRLLTHVGILLALALLVSLSMIVGREFRCVAREGGKLPFTEIFGEVPIRPTEFMEDHRFIHSDPYDGTWDTWTGNDSAKRPWTVWDDLYAGTIKMIDAIPNVGGFQEKGNRCSLFLGSWIEVPHPWAYGLPKGGPLLKASVDSAAPETEAYVPSVLHQIHCMGELKHLLLALETGKTLPGLEHATHCVEYLRQSIMCSADLTLEWPNNPKGIMGWGTIHQCRDWSFVRKLFLSHKAIIDRG